jgi:peptide/nickel transport system substrate-binding protein
MPTESTRRFLATLFTIAICFEVGCDKVETGHTATRFERHPYTHAHELRFAAGSDIQSLNPLISSSINEDYLTQLCMAYLTRADRRGNATVPELATEVPSRENGGVSRDGKTIIWHLRHGARWSDGAPFTADDVVFTTKLILDPSAAVADTDGWNLITKIDEPDTYTVVYHLRSPYSTFATTFFFAAGVSVLPKHLLRSVRNLRTASYNALPVGIGPFRFQSWKRGESVVMVRNPYYFRGRAKLDRIVFKIVPDASTMLTQLRTHELDLWIDVPPHLYPQVRAIEGFDGIATPSTTYDHLDFNLTNPILADVRVRRALRLAVDRRAIVNKVQHGLYQLDESVVTPASPYHIDLPLVPFDIAKADALLDSAGWKRGKDGVRVKGRARLHLTFVQKVGQPDFESELELIRNSWQLIGVELTVKRYLASQLFATAQDGGIIFGGKFDVARFGWESTPDEDLASIYACDSLPPVGQNDPHWCDREATAAMDDAKIEYHQKARAKDLAVVQRRVYDQVPTVVLDASRQLSAYNDDLKNWHPNPMSPAFNDIMNVDI